jgi:hypothetical protein
VRCSVTALSVAFWKASCGQPFPLLLPLPSFVPVPPLVLAQTAGSSESKDGGQTLDQYLASLRIQSPPSPVPALPPSSSKPASFASLPPELKTKIARQVQAVDKVDSEKDGARNRYYEAAAHPDEVFETVEDWVREGGERTQ